MPSAIYTMTVAGQTLSDLKNNLKSVVETMDGHEGRTLTPAGLGLSVSEAAAAAEAETNADTSVDDDQPAPILPIKRRGRPPGSTTAASQATTSQATTSQATMSQANGAASPAVSSQSKPLPQLRQEATDILKACWGAQPDGAEKVIALQQKFNVKRFAEVGDDRIPTLHQAAVALQHELAGGAAATEETGPF